MAVTKDLQILVHQLRDNKLTFGDTPETSNLSEAESTRLRSLAAAADRLILNSKTGARQVDAFDVARAVAVRAHTELRRADVSEGKARRRAAAIV